MQPFNGCPAASDSTVLTSWDGELLAVLLTRSTFSVERDRCKAGVLIEVTGDGAQDGLF